MHLRGPSAKGTNAPLGRRRARPSSQRSGLNSFGVGEALGVAVRGVDADQREVALGQLVAADRSRPDRLAADGIRRRIEAERLVDHGFRVGQVRNVGDASAGHRPSSTDASSSRRLACAAGLRASRYSAHVSASAVVSWPARNSVMTSSRISLFGQRSSRDARSSSIEMTSCRACPAAPRGAARSAVRRSVEACAHRARRRRLPGVGRKSGMKNVMPLKRESKCSAALRERLADRLDLCRP